MRSTKVFIDTPLTGNEEYSPHVTSKAGSYEHTVNTKSRVIENQNISRKRHRERRLGYNQTGRFNRKTQKILQPSKDLSGKNLKSQIKNIKHINLSFKRILLYAFFISVSFVLMLPFIIDLRSNLWEKKSSVRYNNDTLYNIFLLEGISNKKNEKKPAEKVDGFSLPNFKVIRYVVKRGDTLFGISRKFNTSIDAIITANNLKNAVYLTVGKKLLIPNIPGIFYRVKKGDTLSSIARKYKVKVSRIADVNDLSSDIIAVGDKIFIPGASLSNWERALVLGNIFKTPTRGRLTSKMGFRRDPFTGRIAYHSGVDIANRTGTPVYAAQFGRVVYTGYKGNYGKTIVIAHPRGYTTLYGHLSRISVRRGQVVTQGQLIGRMGNTGRSTGPHLHFEIRQYGKLINPSKMVKIR